MKRNNQNQPKGAGYTQPNGFTPEGYPGAMPYQGYQASQGYPQFQGYQQPQNYQQAQGYPQPMGYQAGRNYQTPQVTGNQPAVGEPNPSVSYTGQGSFSQNGYPQQGFGQTQTGYISNTYPQQNGYQTGSAQYPYTGSQAPAGSYIPQTPYSQGYTAPDYQNPGRYNQGYGAYNQMGRPPQVPAYQQQEMGGQVPLNGGGYVPQPVPVRKRPFVMTDYYLLLLCAVLLALFVLGMFVPGFGVVRWAFLVLAAASTLLLWIRPLVEKNKRLCFTIVFALLMILTVIGFVNGGSGGRNSDSQKTGSSSSVTDPVSGQAAAVADPASVLSITSTPSITYTPEPDQDTEVTDRLKSFFYYWSANRQDDMLTLCSPSWASKVENPQTALFGLIGTRTPKDYREESISGTSYDTMRTVTVNTLIDRNNGKDAVRYRMSVSMVKESDGLWYVDPKSLQSFENAETPDPSVTDTPAPTATPAISADTMLYYNPSGGEFYHLDQNCRRINERYLPLQGHFKYSELGKDPYNKLKPCAICGAPSPGQ